MPQMFLVLPVTQDNQAHFTPDEARDAYVAACDTKRWGTVDRIVVSNPPRCSFSSLSTRIDQSARIAMAALLPDFVEFEQYHDMSYDDVYHMLTDGPGNPTLTQDVLVAIAGDMAVRKQRLTLVYCANTSVPRTTPIKVIVERGKIREVSMTDGPTTK